LQVWEVHVCPCQYDTLRWQKAEIEPTDNFLKGNDYPTRKSNRGDTDDGVFARVEPSRD
jgi:hypothetical protein